MASYGVAGELVDIRGEAGGDERLVDVGRSKWGHGCEPPLIARRIVDQEPLRKCDRVGQTIRHVGEARVPATTKSPLVIPVSRPERPSPVATG